MKDLWLLSISLLLYSSLNAQSGKDFGTGLLLDHTAFEQQVEMTPEFSNDGRRAGDLPRWFSLRAYTPYPKNQGEINSCIGWAMGYAAMTTQDAFARGLTNREAITERAYSALFIYNNVKEGSCLSGAYVQKAAAFLKENGDCKSTDFDFPYSDCAKEPDPELFFQSQENMIKDYVALFQKDTPPKTKVMRTKRSIAEGKPVVVGMRITESLKGLSPENPVWKPRPEYDRNLGGHALAVVGYNDSLGVFEIMNSWGVDWGEQGFFYVGYQAFTENTVQALQLILPEIALNGAEKEAKTAIRLAALAQQKQARIVRDQARTEIEKAEEAQQIAQQIAQQNASPQEQQSAAALLQQAEALIRQAEQSQQEAEMAVAEATAAITETELDLSVLAGDFVLRVPLTDDYGTLIQDRQGNFQFQDIPAEWDGEMYHLTKKDWEEGDMFQVIAQNIKPDTYVYLFSLDGNNKAEIHWPRNQRFEEQFDGHEVAGAGEGALVAHAGAEILIPGADRVLVRENLKEDYICLLYSAEKIDNFQERILQLKNAGKGAFLSRFQTAFADLLVPAPQIEYGQERMYCRLDQLDEGMAIPLIIKVENE